MKKKWISLIMVMLLLVTLVSPADISHAMPGNERTIETEKGRDDMSASKQPAAEEKEPVGNVPTEESEKLNFQEEQTGIEDGGMHTEQQPQNGSQQLQNGGAQEPQSGVQEPQSGIPQSNPEIPLADTQGNIAKPTNPSVQTDINSGSVDSVQVTEQLRITNREEAFLTGMEAELRAESTLNKTAAFRWQVSEDGENWQDIEGAAERVYRFIVSEDMFAKWYRICANDGKQTYASESVQMQKAVCYTVTAGKNRAASQITGHADLEKAFAENHNSLGSEEVDIILLQDIIVESTIDVGTPKTVASYTNTYTLKSQQGQTYQISPKNGFKGDMFKMRGDSDATISGDSKVILENVAIQGYPVGQEPVGVGHNQCDSLFHLLNNREPTGNKDDGNTWLEIRGGVKLDNPGAPVVKLMHQIQSDAVTINAEGQAPITIKGEIEVPGARNMVSVRGTTANLTPDSDVVFSLDYYAIEGGWGATENRWLMKYSEAVAPTEVAYFRLKDPKQYWIVAKGGKESSLQIHSNRPDTIYLGPVLSDGKTRQTDVYADGVFPGSVGGDTSQSAVSQIAIAYAKIRQLNLEESAPNCNLAIVSEITINDSYRFAENGFSGEGYSWNWKQPAEIHRYYRPERKAAGDAGYQDENYKGVLFRVGAGADCTMEYLTLNGKPNTSAPNAETQAPMLVVEGQGKLAVRNSSLINNENMAENAKGGAVYLADGADFWTENITIQGNRVKEGGHGAGVYQENAAGFRISGSYITEDNQQVWLSDSAKITVKGGFSVSTAFGIPIDFTTYEAGRVVAEYAEGLPTPDLNEVEKFGPNRTKLFGAGLYLENADRTIVLAERTGGLSFGFTKQDKTGKPIADTIFRLYKCKSSGEKEHTHSRLADLYQTEENNCWTQISQQQSDAAGILNFGFLKDGEYRLAESYAPYGYEAPKGQWKLTIKTMARTDEKIVLEYIPIKGETDPGSKIVLDEVDGTDAAKSYIRNKDAVLTDFSFKVETSDQGKPGVGIAFEFYSCEHWENPQHTHEELATPECVENGGCWLDYDRNADKNGQFVSGSDGMVHIENLMDGDYMLKQITAVNGYELPTGQWLIRIRHGEENPITMLGKGEHTGDNFQIEYDSSTGKFDYILTNRLLVEPGHEKYVKYNKDSGDYTLTLDVTGNQRVAQQSENPVSVVLIMDTVCAYYPTENFNRIKNTASKIIEKVLAVDSENEVAIVDMHGSYNNMKDGTYDDAYVQETGTGKTWTNNKNEALNAVNSLQMKKDEGTGLEDTKYSINWQAGFRTAQDLFTGKAGKPKERNDRVILFLPGGTTNFSYDENGITEDVSEPKPYYDRALPDAKKLMELADKSRTTLKVVSVSENVDDRYANDGNKVWGNGPELQSDMKTDGYKVDTLYQLYKPWNNDFDEKALQTLVDSFNSYEPKYFLQENVTVTDTLSEYAELAAETWEGNYKLEAIKADGSPGEIPEGTEASWDADAKKVTLKFPKEFQLENGTTYKISFDIRPTQKAYGDYIEQGLGYGKAVGDWGTDAPGNETSSGKPGFFCNTEAKVTYDFGNHKDAECEYRRPVIQVAKEARYDLLFMKVDDADVEDSNDDPIIDLPLEGAEFTIYTCLNHEQGHEHEILASKESVESGCWRTVKKNGQNMTCVSDKDGMVYLSLPVGEYILVETKAPQGYRLPKGQLLLKVGNEQTDNYMEFQGRGDDAPRFFYEDTYYLGVVTPKVTNKKGITEPLPNTGGEGTTVLYITGLFLLTMIGMTFCSRKGERKEQSGK